MARPTQELHYQNVTVVNQDVFQQISRLIATNLNRDMSRFVAKRASPARFERATYCLGGNRSILLSYGNKANPSYPKNSLFLN